MTSLLFFDYRKLVGFFKHLFVITLLLMGYVLLYGTQVGGTPHLEFGLYDNHIYVDFISISPVLFIVPLSGILSRWNWERRGAVLEAIALLVPIWFNLATPNLLPCVCT